MNAIVITSIIVGGLVLIIWIAARMPTAEKLSQQPCYFQGVHAALGAVGGREIGTQECSGPPEYSYAVQPMHPAHVLQSVKVCPAHVGALSELAAALGDGASGYWIVPNG